MDSSVLKQIDIDTNSIVKRFNKKIAILARKMISNQEIAREAAQETWYEILKSINTYKGSSKIDTWIYIIAKRTILKYAKKERTYSEKVINYHFEKAEIEYTGEKAKKSEWVKEKCHDCLTAFCHCLNNENRLIFIFRDIINLPYDIISDIMNKSKESLRKQLSRSRKRIKNFLIENCVLFYPQSSCRCRIKKHVFEVNLHRKFEKLEKMARLINFFEKTEKVLPKKAFWEEFLFKSDI